ncbi:MAG: SDR family oxidoreductase [Chloroflexi bacterium]|nr:SDR family oxidoreductase [Chloroflexota bacterium]
MGQRSFADRVAIVTGAGQGMGEVFAKALAGAGAIVGVAEIDPETGRQTADDITAAGGRAHPYVVDVRDKAAIDAMTADLVARYGRLDILVNNAGVAAGGPSEDVTETDWDRVYGIMLKGMFLCCQSVGRTMIPQGSGVIVNICSMAGIGGWAKRALYTPAKAGAISLTQVLGVEWARHGIRVVGINPGQIETPLNEYVFSRGLASREQFTNRAPMRRFGSPEEIAEAVLFLASDAASGITAEVVTIDGGWTAWGGIEALDA